jgi:hypothetical protein
MKQNRVRLALALGVSVALTAATAVAAAPAHRGSALPAPSAPFERASAHGISVVAGANGIVEFHATALSQRLAAVLRGGSVSYGCFQAGGSGGYQSAFEPTLRFRFASPLNGCEIEASYGRRWPDPFGSHAAVEIAFTPLGRAYFSDRAAARDLALFVRTGLTQAMRAQGGPAFEKEVTARYGRTIIRLSSPAAPIAPNRIAYTPTLAGATLVEQSATGKRFSVELAHGYIKQQHLRPYTFLVLFQKRH